jgi:hypothetical protein
MDKRQVISGGWQERTDGAIWSAPASGTLAHALLEAEAAVGAKAGARICARASTKALERSKEHQQDGCERAHAFKAAATHICSDD